MKTKMTDTGSEVIEIKGATTKAVDRAAETTQLDDRAVGLTVGEGITPPYNPSKLAAFQELNGTHAIAVEKKAKREVGFGFGITPHQRAEDPSDEERERAEAFWRGRDSIWKIGPTGTPTATPVEVFEKARQDYHGIGWLAIELIYGDDDTLHGLAHVPAESVRVKKSEEDDRQAGHGYVQVVDGDTVYFGEAGDRHQTDVDGNPNPIYVDKTDGEVGRDRDAVGELANELLYIPNPHPNTRYYGLPAWISEIQTMVGDQEAKRFNREFFEWDSVPQYAVIVEGGRLSDEARDDVRDLVKCLREKEGRRVAVLDAEELAERGVNVEQNVSIRLEPLARQGEEDMSFAEYRRMNEHDIAKVHEVPPQLIGVMESSNRGNITEAIRDFTKEVIEPAQARFAGRLYRIIHQQILDINDWTLNFETRGAENEREDAEIAETRIGAASQYGGVTVNEARELQGFEPLDEPTGEMLVAELRGGAGDGVEQGIRDLITEEVEDAAAELETEARTMARMQRGAEADD